MQAEAALPPVAGLGILIDVERKRSRTIVVGCGPRGEARSSSRGPAIPERPEQIGAPVPEPSSHRVSLQAGVPVAQTEGVGQFEAATFHAGGQRDEPLIRLPVTPRAPLAVRRTPDSPRLQVVSRAVRAVERDPALEFETARAASPRDDVASVAPSSVPRAVDARESRGDAQRTHRPQRPATRMVAAAIDHVLLLAIDAGVIYFTLRIAGLSMGDWTRAAAVPLVCVSCCS